MAFIGRFASGDWQGGLASMFGGTIGESVLDVAMGRQSIGQTASNLGKEVAIQAPIAIATMGIGSALGAAASGISKAAQGAIQAGTTAGKVAAGTAKALNAVSGSLGTLKGTFGGNGIKGVAKGVGQTARGIFTQGLLNPQSIKTVGGKLTTGLKGVATGGASALSKEASTATAATVGQGYVGTLPDIGSSTGKVVTATTGTASKIAAQGSARVVGSSAGGGVTGVEPAITGTKQLATTGTSKLATAGKSIAAGAKKLVGQYGVQGALSIASGIQAAKQANAANQVQTQSLLFQKQTYEEAKAKEESTKAQLKSDAWNAYSSASLFGENLYGSDSNNTLLTSYNTNGTGNQGVFSLLNTGVTTRKTEDII